MHSATLCSSPNQGQKEHLPEISPAVLTQVGCGREGVRPICWCGPHVGLWRTWASRDGEEGRAAASRRGQSCASLGYRERHFEQESDWMHALSWSGADSAPARTMAWGGHGSSIYRISQDVQMHGVAEWGPAGLWQGDLEKCSDDATF